MAAPIWVISLDRTPQRWRAFEAENAGAGAFERFSAVDGRLLSREDLIGRGLLSAEVDYTPGALGCALSHAALWRRCLESGEAATVCEDDAILRPDFALAAAQAVLQRPGFDLILWGWNFNSVLGGRVFGDTPFAMGFDQERMRASVAAFRLERPAPALLRLTRALGTPGYTISPAGARRLLERCLPIAPVSVLLPLLNREASNNGIDIAMNAAYPDLAAYVSFPPLVLTRNEVGASTVG